jgi:hypothetical protein
MTAINKFFQLSPSGGQADGRSFCGEGTVWKNGKCIFNDRIVDEYSHAIDSLQRELDAVPPPLQCGPQTKREGDKCVVDYADRGITFHHSQQPGNEAVYYQDTNELDQVPPFFKGYAKCEGHQVAAKAIGQGSGAKVAANAISNSQVIQAHGEQIRGLNNKCLDYWPGKDGKPNNGDKPHMWECQKGNRNQEWIVTDKGDKKVEIRSVHGKCLDFNGSTTHMFDCVGNNNQKWTRGKIGSETELIFHPSRKAYLHADLSKNGGKVETKTSFGTGERAQIWYVGGTPR